MSRYRLKICLFCSSGRHGSCLIYNCQCPLSECVDSRNKGLKGSRLQINPQYVPKDIEPIFLKEKETDKEPTKVDDQDQVVTDG